MHVCNCMSIISCHKMYRLLFIKFNILIVFVTFLVKSGNLTEPSVKFMLRGQTYMNHSTVAINDIGDQSDHDALLCVTNNPDCCKSPNGPSQGDFYYPNGTAVGSYLTNRDETMYRDRGPQVVRLKRRNDALSPTGVYRCEIPDLTGTNQIMCINITAIKCPALPDIKNGTVVYSDNKSGPYYDYHTTATYHCDEGYVLTGDEDHNRTCIKNDNFIGIWNEHASSCLAIKCPALPDIKNGMIKYSGNKSGPLYNYHTTATYRCNEGYRLTGDEDHNRMCIKNGRSSTGIWSRDASSCSAISCPALPVIKNGMIDYSGIKSGSYYDYHTTATYHCDEGYVLTGDEDHIRTCIKNGSSLEPTGVWSGNVSSCSELGIKLILHNWIYENNSNVTINKIGEGDSALMCMTNYSEYCNGTLQGTFYFPDDSLVGNESTGESLYTDRGPRVIQLNRRNDTLSPTGLYRCEIPDSTGKLRSIYINISSIPGGSRISIEGLVFGIFILLIITASVLVVVFVLWSQKTGRATISSLKISFRKEAVLSRYRVTAEETNLNNDQETSLSSSIDDDEIVQETMVCTNECEREDGQNYQELYSQSCGIRPRNSFSLHSFPSHVNRMHGDSEKLFRLEYKSISRTPQAPYNEAVRSVNKPRNRFRNIFPYNFNRVKLNAVPGREGSDYINASFIKGFMTNTNYIAAQGPLPKTLNDFWRMILEHRLPTIVMITKLVEDRKKCECYWPLVEGHCLELNSGITVTLVKSTTLAEFTVRKMNVFNSSDSSSTPLVVTQFHYTAWPDHNVPSNGMSLIYFIQAVRNVHPHTHPKHLLVHCSAGVGRTGTFIVLDTMLEMMVKDKIINICDCVTHIRKQRVLLVQTVSQYIFLFDTLNELIICGETKIDAQDLRTVMEQRLVVTRGETSNGFQKQFKTLEQFSQQDESVDYYSALQIENRSKNRFASIVPNEEYRVVLNSTVSGSDYINASFICGYQNQRVYIATQGPLKHTTGDFWSMVMENQCTCIVMLCALREGMEEASYRYWPKKVGETKEYDDCFVTLESNEVVGDYTIEKLEVSKNFIQGATESTVINKVTLFHFTTWKADECPLSSFSLLNIVENVNKIQRSTNNNPIVVMCNNGIGRTGVFITLHAQMERLKNEGVVDIFQFIKAARKQRQGLVQSPEHYIFCHEIIADYLESFEDYANFKKLV